MAKLKECFKNIAQIFWPFLEGERKEDNSLFTQPKEMLNKLETINDINLLTQFLTMAEKLYLEEKDRLRTVEAKGTTFLGTSGFAAALLIWLAQTIKSEGFIDHYWLSIIVTVLYTFTQIYFIMTIYYSACTLSRRRYSTIDRAKIFPREETEYATYLKRIAVIYITNYSRNLRITNEKTDLVALAQENFLRALICIGVIGVLFAIDKLLSLV
ncbi:hypothetical protein MGLY_20610 [Neomoorella glycerini]|uniref:Uncharacterized protein n=1 Tax=Neomoorella glycerini TaxID=55779 RepID=A0A6I5ZRN4_9FIRM|nr:hypothetical protein [Moorella glycerini]QGP92673.1 hypothetical protein MGLY_20610 [Moorella glycerini]